MTDTNRIFSVRVGKMARSKWHGTVFIVMATSKEEARTKMESRHPMMFNPDYLNRNKYTVSVSAPCTEDEYWFTHA